MNAHSFISHRMFVAAISQEGTTEDYPQPEPHTHSTALEADARRRGLDFLRESDLRKPAIISPVSTMSRGQW